MKTYGRIRYLVQALAVLLLLLLVGGLMMGCHPEEDDPAPTPAEEDWNVDLSLYKIMRSDFATKPVTQAVSLLRKTIIYACGYEDYGVGTDFVNETESERAEYEIIVGHTNIPEENEVYETLGEGEYAICLRGTKLIIVGASEDVTAAAVEVFMKKYLNYDADKYQNDPLGTDKIKITDEKNKVSNILSGGRVVEEVEEPDPDPIEMTSLNFRCGGGAKVTEDGILFQNGTCTAETTLRTDPGPYRLQATIEIQGSVMPQAIQFFFNTGGSSVNISVTGNGVTIVRHDYERGGTSFPGDAKHFTLRADVYPDSELMRYYINGNFMGEMNVASNDYPLVDCSTLNIAAVGGSGMEVLVHNVYLEAIVDEAPRLYQAKVETPDNESIYPKSQNAPAKEIYVVDTATLSDDDLLTLMTLQGIVNRTTPRIFADYRKYNNDGRYVGIANEQVYLDMLEAKGRTVTKAKLKDLLVTFKDEYKGVIFGAPFNGGTNYEENVVTTLAGVLDGVYMTEGMYSSLKDQIQKDILFRTAGRFTGAVDAYMWLWKTYGDQCSKTVLFHMPTGSEKVGHPAMMCRDYAVMSRAFVFCTDGIETLEDYDFYMDLFASTAPNTAVVGQGGGCFSEFEMFLICGRFGKYFTYGFSTPNMSLFNSLEVGELKQSVPEKISLESNTVYVTFDLSEGDNLSWDYHLWMKNYNETETRGQVAKGYSICGALYYVAPAILEYYYQNATPNDCFFMDGGGISNLSCPDDFGYMYMPKDREKIVARMLELTEYVAQKADLHVMRALQNISDEMAARYSEECPSIRGLFSSYSATTYQIGGFGGDYKQSIYMVDDVVRSRLTMKSDWQRTDIDVQLKDFMKKAPSEDGIYFARFFLYGNQILDNLAYFKQMEDRLKATGANIVVVRPDVFVDLYAEYAK